MRSRAVFLRSILLALFLFAYEANIVHSTHHFNQEHADCHICASSKHLDASLHHTMPPIIIDATNLEVGKLEQRVELKRDSNTAQKPLLRLVDYSRLRHYIVAQIPLGYLSTAPPYTFS